MATFIKMKIEDVATVIDCPHSTPKWTKRGFFAVRNFNLSNGRIIKEKVSYVSDEIFSERTRRGVPKNGDCILSREAPIGSVGYVNTNEKMCLGQRVVLIQPKDNIEGRYLLYQLLSSNIQKQFKQSDSTGSTVSNLRIPLIKNTLISYTDIKTQKMIGSTIAAYDDLIDNNEKRIKVLEEMAQLLYTEWFVRFKYPGHEKVRMVDSGTKFGVIPAGWVIKKYEDVINYARGCSYSSEQISDNLGEFYIVNLKSFNRGGGFRFEGAKYYTGPINKEQLLNQGDVVVAVTDMTGDRAVIARPARIPKIRSHKVILSADVVKIISDELPTSFIYYSMLDYHFTETTKNKANGANVLHLKPSAILEYQAIIPPIELLHEFDNKCKGIMRLIDSYIERNQVLANTRDLLIPQLVTGKRELK